MNMYIRRYKISCLDFIYNIKTLILEYKPKQNSNVNEVFSHTQLTLLRMFIVWHLVSIENIVVHLNRYKLKPFT